MIPDQRAVVAAIAANIVNGRSYRSASLHGGGNVGLSIQIADGRVVAHDFGRGVALMGRLDLVHDFGTGAPLLFWAPKGARVTGHDHGSKCGFCADVAGDVVKLYDDETGETVTFQLS